MTHDQGNAMAEAASCSLAPDALAGRLSEWHQLAAQALRRRVEPGRVTSTYPNRRAIATQLAHLVAAEQDCCPFLHFDVHEADDIITVELRYPAELTPMVTAVLGGHPAR